MRAWVWIMIAATFLALAVATGYVTGYADAARTGLPVPADGKPWKCWSIHRAIGPDATLCCQDVGGVIRCWEE